MTTIEPFISLPGLKTLSVAALTLVLASPVSEAAARDPFKSFLGKWTGSGDIVGSDGHKEAIRCRADYAATGDALKQSVVCASQSFKLDISSSIQASEGTLQGSWTEATRGITGMLQGRIDGGRVEAQVNGGTFTAGISLTSNGRSQTVVIRPSAGGVTEVRIELQRRG
jgi:hypothetical protein